MRRRHVLAIIVILIAAYILAWHLSPTRVLSLLVVNKTVPDDSFREHRAIFWVAEHRRFSDPDGRFYDHRFDYLGFHPESREKNLVTAKALADVELLYLVDAYGIYNYEEGLRVYETKLPYEHQEIDLIYGGLSLAEAEAIALFASDETAVLIGEHNIFGYPTSLNPEAALLLQDIFAVSYDGWLARYYEDLDEVAFWMKELYSRIYGKVWDLDGPGMVFVREDDTAFNWHTDLVIVPKTGLTGPWPVLVNSDDQLLHGAATNVPYLYWVEVLETGPGAEVLAYYDLPLKDEYRTALHTRGLPDRLPAMVSYSPAGEAKRIYFAGDFADQLPALLPPNLTGSAGLQRLLSYTPGLPVEYRFYFQWYEPVLNNILNTGGRISNEEK